MRALILLALCAAAYTLSFDTELPNENWINEIIDIEDRQIQEDAYRAQKEYRYLYNGQLCTGIPQSSKQHACTRIQALVSLVFKNQHKMLVQLTHIRMGQLNRQMPNPRQIQPFQAYEQVPINEELEQRLRLPIMCKYQHGLIREIVFDGQEQPWSANIKRGVLNMLQVNLKQHKRTDLAEEQLLLNEAKAPEDPQNDFFTCQERTIEGDCETYYTITKQPNYWYNGDKEVMNVTKSINFEKCRQRPDIRYNQRFSSQCPTCERKFVQLEKLLESSTIARYNISGTPEQFLIEKACVESHYLFTPVNEQTDIIATYVNQTLELVKCGPIENRVEEPNNPQESDSQMVYTPEWDILKEKFFMEGDQQFLKQSPYAEIKNKLKIVKEIIARLIAHTQDEQKGFTEEAPRQLARLVKILRMCTFQELNQIYEKIYEQLEQIPQQKQQFIRDMLIDAQALASTKNTIEHLVQKITQKKINPIKGAMVLKSLVNSRVVSQQQIDIVLNLCKHQVAKRNPILKQSCYLTVGSMINAMCKENKDKLALEFKVQPQQLCPRTVKEKYLQQLIELFQEAETKYEKVLALKTLANAGIDLSIFELEKIIRNTGLNQPHQNIIRMQAIDALRHLREVMPRKIQKVLMPVYKNKWEQCEVRMTAVYQILQTIPEKPIIDQIAQQLMQERCQQIVSFVNTLLTSYANSTVTCERQMAEDLQLSLRHAQSQPWVPKLGMSRFYHFGGYSKKYNIGGALNLAAMFDNQTFLPKELMISYDDLMAGHWWRNTIQFGFVQQNGEQVFEQLLGAQGLLYEKSFSEIFTRAKRAISQPKSILTQIYQKLGISGRRDQTQEPMAMFYIRFMDQDYAIIPFDTETMPEVMRQMVQQEQLNIESIQKFLAQGYQMNYHSAAYVHECQRKIPTTLGIPLLVAGKIPTIAGVKGHIKANFQPKKQIKNIELFINARPKLAATAIQKVEAWTPIVNTGLKVVRSVQFNVPVQGELKINIEKPEQPELEIQWLVPQEKLQLVHFDARPVTYTRVWPKFLKTYADPIERTIYGEDWNRQQKVHKEIGQNEIGIQMNVRGQWHRTPYQALAGTPIGAFAGHNFFQIIIEPTEQTPKKVILKANAQVFKDMEENFELIPEEFEQFYQTEEEQTLFENEFETEQPRKHFKKFQKYAQSYRGVNPLEHRMQIQIYTQGGQHPCKAEMIAKTNCDQNMHLCKWQLEFMRTPIPSGYYQETQPWEFIAEGQILYPQIPYTLKQLEEYENENQKAGMQVKCEWGPKNNKQQYVNFKVQAERSEEQKKLQRECLYNQAYEQQKQSHIFSPVMQYDELLKQAMLTKYKIHCDYNINSQYVKNYTNKVYRALKYFNYWNAQVDQITAHNPQKQMQAIVELDPRNYQYVNVTMRLPHENLRITDMSLYVPVKPINIRRASTPIRSFPELIRSYTNQYIQQPKCIVSSERIQTFDQVKYRVPITTCYSVLAKDCSGYDDEQPQFAVLIKKLQQQKEAKKVKIISHHHVIELEAKQEEYSFEDEQPVKVYVDGKQIELTQQKPTKVIRKHQQVVCRIEKMGPYVKVYLPQTGVKVYFDGYACSIKAPEYYQNAQCGLCGHYDGEYDQEYRNPQNQAIERIPEFHKAYLYKEEECQIDEPLIENEEEYRYKPFMWEDEQVKRQIKNRNQFWDSSSEELDGIDSFEKDIYEQQYTRSEWEPRPETKVIELANEICFSLKPVPQCPKNTYITQELKNKKVAFGCLPRSSSQAQSLRLLVHKQGKIMETETLPQSMVDTVQVPKMCKQF